ncbi:MAG: hypothetical protein ACNYPE_01150 [Candidatus Azotimanducaceae bacterium WSBS_2022_MAG_OTU7]
MRLAALVLLVCVIAEASLLFSSAEVSLKGLSHGKVVAKGSTRETQKLERIFDIAINQPGVGSQYYFRAELEQ